MKYYTIEKPNKQSHNSHLIVYFLILIMLLSFGLQPGVAQSDEAVPVPSISKNKSTSIPKIGINNIPKKRIEAVRPKISPAEYHVYKNKSFKSPFRYPLARIPLVEGGNTFEDLSDVISQGKLPNEIDIRIEKLINSIEYNYPAPQNKNKPLEIYTELMACPWNKDKRLLHVGIQAIKIDRIQGLSDPNVPMAADVDIHVEFNPAYVVDYKLVGYEDHLPNLLSYSVDPATNSTLETGQSLTAIYEFTPTQNNFDKVDQILLYQKRDKSLIENNELGAVKVSYRPPSGRKTWQLKSKIRRTLKANFKIDEKTFLAVAIAEAAMILKESPHRQNGSIDKIIKTLTSMDYVTSEGELEKKPLSVEGEKVLSLLKELKEIQNSITIK